MRAGTPTRPIGILQSDTGRLRDAARLAFADGPVESPRSADGLQRRGFGRDREPLPDYDRELPGDRRPLWHITYQGSRESGDASDLLFAGHETANQNGEEAGLRDRTPADH